VTDLDLVAANLGVLRRPVVLVTSDGDRSVPSSYSGRTVRQLLESAMVVRWLTQNYDGSVRHRKLRPMPIGLDLHSPQWQLGSRDAKIAHIAGLNTCGRKRADGVLCDAHLNQSHPDRAGMFRVLRNNRGVTFVAERLPFADLMRLYGEYQFVLSPRGSGLDCHRTWEAILAGCIVVTVKSPLDSMFIENGFPVVILETWAELNESLPQKLAEWRATYGPRTALGVVWPKLLSDYWTSDALVVGGTARDCAPHLPHVLARLDALAMNRRVWYVFYESNSSDDTLHILQRFVSERRGLVLTERTSGIRTERIAQGRNAIVEHVERLAGSYDFFVNLDLDDMTEHLDVSSVEQCLLRSNEWDIATANRRTLYYDLWALRTADKGDFLESRVHCIKGHTDTPVTADSLPCFVPALSEWFPLKQELREKATFPLDGPYFEVSSAFCGLAIYKTAFLRGARYVGKKKGDVPECEHVPFHAAIRAQFPHVRIVVAPYLVSGE
jgi:hypothetical protein